jgi:hypothetical protein
MTRKFDLEAAKKGEPILWGGKPVRFGAHLPDANEFYRVIVVCADGNIATTDEQGCVTHMNSVLTMAPRKQQLWVRAYMTGDGEIELAHSMGVDRDAFFPKSVRWLDPEPRLHGEYEVGDE